MSEEIELYNPVRGKLKYATTEWQIQSVVDLDCQYFGELGYRFEDLESMISNYPKGTFIFTAPGSNKLLLTIGLWPISSQLFHQMKNEALPESNIRPEEILTDGGGQYWWIAGFLGEPNSIEVGPRLVARFISAVLEEFIKELDKDNISFVATGFSISGQSLLKRFNFTPTELDSHRYYLETDLNYIKDMAKTLLPPE